MHRSRIESLQQTPMFGAIREDTIRFLLDRARILERAAGECFFREGDRGNSAFLLEAGALTVLKTWGDSEHILRQLTAGDCFGEVALLDLGPRSATVRAEVDSRALEFSASDLRAVADFDVEQFALIYMNLGRELSRRLRDADARLFRARCQDETFRDGYASSAGSL